LFSYQRVASRSSCASQGIFLKWDNSTFVVKCFDVSQQGIGIISPTPLAAGKHVYIAIAAARMQGYVLEGRVCWCNKERDGWHAGVELDKPIPFELERITQ
jgi:hypothetical protein